MVWKRPCQPLNDTQVRSVRKSTLIAVRENAAHLTTEWGRAVRSYVASVHDGDIRAEVASRPMPDHSSDQRSAKFDIGQVVKHNLFEFRGVVFDVDPEFANTEEWWQAIPESVRPQKDQPFYHLLATNGDSCYVAYASEGNLCADNTGQPLSHPQTRLIFERFENGRYLPKQRMAN